MEKIDSQIETQNFEPAPEIENNEQQNNENTGFTIPNFSGELINTVLSIYCKFRPEIDKDMFLLTDEEKELISKFLDPLLLKGLQKAGIAVGDFEIIVSVIVISFPRGYTIYIIEKNRRKIAKQKQPILKGEVNGQKIKE